MRGIATVTEAAEKEVAAQKGPGYPFRCSRDFPRDFKYAWGFPARCAVCGQEIRGRDVIRWRESGNPRSVVHAGCEAAEAWREVLQAVYDVGIYKGPPTFSRPAIEKAVDTIGWREICMSEVGDPAIRAHFMQVYESYRQRQLDEMRYPQLPGGFKLELPGREPIPTP